MITAAQAADACASLYGLLPNWKPAVLFDGIVDGSKVYAGLFEVGDEDVLVYRGSATGIDWLRDFDALLQHVPGMGAVSAGFHAGMPAAFDTIRKAITTRRKLNITGHSLGAARADIGAAQFLLAGFAVESLWVFGEPKPGLRDLAAVINRLPGRSIINSAGHGDRHDLVCDVPLTLPVFEYVHPRLPLQPIHGAPAANDEWGVFAYHHIQLYQQGIQTHTDSMAT